MRSNYNSTKVCFAYFGLLLGETLRKKKPWLLFLMAHPTGTKSKVQSVSHFLRITGSTTPATAATFYFFLWPTISPSNVRRSTRVRRFSIAGVSNEMCGISQRYSAMNQIGFSVLIQFR